MVLEESTASKKGFRHEEGREGGEIRWRRNKEEEEEQDRDEEEEDEEEEEDKEGKEYDF